MALVRAVERFFRFADTGKSAKKDPREDPAIVAAILLFEDAMLVGERVRFLARV